MIWEYLPLIQLTFSLIEFIILFIILFSDDKSFIININNNKKKPEKQGQVQKYSEQEQTESEQKPAKKKAKFEFKKEDMVLMTYDF